MRAVTCKIMNMGAMVEVGPYRRVLAVNVRATRTLELCIVSWENYYRRLGTVATRRFTSCNHVLHMPSYLVSRATAELRDERQRKTRYSNPKVLASRLLFSRVTCQRTALYEMVQRRLPWLHALRGTNPQFAIFTSGHAPRHPVIYVSLIEHADLAGSPIGWLWGVNCWLP